MASTCSSRSWTSARSAPSRCSTPRWWDTSSAQRRGVVRVAHYVVPVLGAAVTLWVIAEASPLAQMVGGLWTAAALVILAVGRGRPASEVLP